MKLSDTEIIKSELLEFFKGFSDSYYPKYDIVCDETNNSQEDIALGFLNVSLYPKPPYKTVLNFTITKTKEGE